MRRPGRRSSPTSRRLAFEKALIATGANVRRLNVEGCELEQIHYLRTLGNADAIREGVAEAEEVVLIGGSYIGCEVAASLTMMGKRCTIVMQEETTLERGFGKQAGGFFQGLLEEHGVTVHGNDELERFEGAGRDGRAGHHPRRPRAPGPGGRRRRRGDPGCGASPSEPALTMGERGGVLCSSRLESSVAGIYAAGDICEYESAMHGGHVRIEHWDVAFNHGKTAARNMLGADVPHEVVPYFFSVLGDWGELEYVGPAYEWDEEIIRGSTGRRQLHELVPQGRCPQGCPDLRPLR